MARIVSKDRWRFASTRNNQGLICLAALGAILICTAIVFSPAFAVERELKPESVNSAEFSSKPLPADRISPLVVRVQVLLARAHFSPGEIDGKFGENAKKALRAYGEARQLSTSGGLSQELWQELASQDRPVLTQYTIQPKDIAGPFLRKLPSKMEDMKNLAHLGYTSPREALAEKFHMSEELLSAFNPGAGNFGRAGDTITVVETGAAGTDTPAAAKVEIDKQQQTVKAFDRAGGLIAVYPATVGSEEKPSPSGMLKVTRIDHDPTYHYNPEYHFKGVHSKTAFTIKPGPNNPVGTVWISLSAEGYGIHGTPNPGKVSKAESHGCVRLTNWDAERLAKMVKKGTPVSFI
jgi:lipoprotein-anchoring transpeptidase ErfK/SrfK